MTPKTEKPHELLQHQAQSAEALPYHQVGLNAYRLKRGEHKAS